MNRITIKIPNDKGQMEWWSSGTIELWNGGMDEWKND